MNEINMRSFYIRACYYSVEYRIKRHSLFKHPLFLENKVMFCDKLIKREEISGVYYKTFDEYPSYSSIDDYNNKSLNITYEGINYNFYSSGNNQIKITIQDKERMRIFDQFYDGKYSYAIKKHPVEKSFWAQCGYIDKNNWYFDETYQKGAPYFSWKANLLI